MALFDVEVLDGGGELLLLGFESPDHGLVRDLQLVQLLAAHVVQLLVARLVRMLRLLYLLAQHSPLVFDISEVLPDSVLVNAKLGYDVADASVGDDALRAKKGGVRLAQELDSFVRMANAVRGIRLDFITELSVPFQLILLLDFLLRQVCEDRVDTRQFAGVGVVHFLTRGALDLVLVAFVEELHYFLHCLLVLLRDTRRASH